jgi:hypothetical protein
MARRKTLPESVRAKQALAERLVALRSELFGKHGGPEVARRLGIPVRTWYNYEQGATVPAEIILKIIKLTSIEAGWLLDGQGPRFRHVQAEPDEIMSPPSLTVVALPRTALPRETPASPPMTARGLLRTAVQLLETAVQLLENDESRLQGRGEVFGGSEPSDARRA